MSEPKKWIEVALMPLVVAVVGIAGTYLITNEQREAAEIRAEADRQLKILDILAEKMISTNKEEKLLAAHLAMSLDSDLALKIMTVFELEAESDIEKEAVRNLTTHAIISKLAEGKRGLAYQEALLEGRWYLRNQAISRKKRRISNWLEFKAEESGLKVYGHNWKGDVTFDGTQGYYLWKFKDGRTGRTDFFIDSTGTLFGKVKGDDAAADINWTYWGSRAAIPVAD